MPGEWICTESQEMRVPEREWSAAPNTVKLSWRKIKVSSNQEVCGGPKSAVCLGWWKCFLIPMKEEIKDTEGHWQGHTLPGLWLWSPRSPGAAQPPSKPRKNRVLRVRPTQGPRWYPLGGMWPWVLYLTWALSGKQQQLTLIECLLFARYGSKCCIYISLFNHPTVLWHIIIIPITKIKTPGHEQIKRLFQGHQAS